MDAVLAGKPRGYLAILTHFQRLVRLELDRRTATVESAGATAGRTCRPCVSGQPGRRRYGAGLDLCSLRVNPALIGGLRVRWAAMFMTAASGRGWRRLQESF